jgi:hypothetical protein
VEEWRAPTESSPASPAREGSRRWLLGSAVGIALVVMSVVAARFWGEFEIVPVNREAFPATPAASTGAAVVPQPKQPPAVATPPPASQSTAPSATKVATEVASTARVTSALPELTARVNDFASVLDGAAEAAIEYVSGKLRAATGDVLIVATVKTRQPFPSIAAYAGEMFKNHGRGIGERGRDNGLLLVLAVDDREVRIEVGLGLEKFVTNGFADQTVQETMIPVLKKGDFGGGLLAGARRLAQRLADARGVTLGLGLAPLPAP